MSELALHPLLGNSRQADALGAHDQRNNAPPVDQRGEIRPDVLDEFLPCEIVSRIDGRMQMGRRLSETWTCQQCQEGRRPASAGFPRSNDAIRHIR